MVPRDIAQELARARSGQSRLRRQARAVDARRSPTTVEGLYASPLQPEAARAHRARRRATSRAATRSTACTSTTRATRTEQFDYSRFAIARVPRRHPAAARRRSARRDARRGRETDDLFAYPDALPGRVDGVPRRAHDGADRAAAARRCSASGRRRSSASAVVPRFAGRVRRAAAGLARLARRAPGRRRRADGLHAGAGALRRADCRRARHRRRPRGLGRHRRLPPDAGADDREHPDRAQARRRRRSSCSPTTA